MKKSILIGLLLVILQMIAVHLYGSSEDPFASIENTLNGATEGIVKIVQGLSILGLVGMGAYTFLTGRFDWLKIAIMVLAIMIVALADPIVSYFTAS